MEGWAERNPRTVLMVVDVPVKHSLSFCAEALWLKMNKNKIVFCYCYLFIIPTIWNLRIVNWHPTTLYNDILLNCSVQSYNIQLYALIFLFFYYINLICAPISSISGLRDPPPFALIHLIPPSFLPSWHVGVPGRSRWEYGSTNVSLEPEGENPHSDPHRQSPLRKAHQKQNISLPTFSPVLNLNTHTLESLLNLMRFGC